MYIYIYIYIAWLASRWANQIGCRHHLRSCPGWRRGGEGEAWATVAQCVQPDATAPFGEFSRGPQPSFDSQLFIYSPASADKSDTEIMIL